MTFIVTAWIIGSVLMGSMVLVDRFLFSNEIFGLNDMKIGDWFYMGFMMCTPFIQMATFVLSLYFLLKEVSERSEKRKKEINKYRKDSNKLHKCSSCGLIKRTYQIKDQTSCCEKGRYYEVSKSFYPEIYEFALESGLTPLLSFKEAKKMWEEKITEVEKAKKAKENQDEMKKSLEKIKFIKEQSDLYLKKEHDKLNAMNEEKTQRIEEALQVLEGEQREEFIKAVELFDELHVVELQKLEEIKKQNEEKLSSLEQKQQKLYA